MSFGPKTAARERMLALGFAGSGKSTAAIDIAMKVPESTMYVIDAEPGGAWTPDGGRMNPGGVQPNIQATAVTDWRSYKEAASKYRQVGGKDDWLVADMLGPTLYEMSQDWYTVTVKGVDTADFYLEFMETRKNKAKNPLEGDTDWKTIRQMYFSVVSDILNFPGHVLAIAAVKPPPRAEYDKEGDRELYGHLGIRPDGEKKMSHIFSTILYFKEKGRGNYIFTTVRERNPRVGPQREYVENKAWSDFSKQYLWEVAGWRPGR